MQYNIQANLSPSAWREVQNVRLCVQAQLPYTNSRRWKAERLSQMNELNEIIVLHFIILLFIFIFRLYLVNN